MNRTAKSFRGESVNFDLFDIKNQILQAPANETTKAREKFINKKRRRTNKQKIAEVLANKNKPITAEKIETVEKHEEASSAEPASDIINVDQPIIQNRKVKIKK